MTVIPQPTRLTTAGDGTWDAWNRLIVYLNSTFGYHNSLYDGLNRRIIFAESDASRNYYYSDQWQSPRRAIRA